MKCSFSSRNAELVAKSKTRCPCKGCIDRKAGCHCMCKQYRSFRTEYDAVKDKAYIQASIEDYVVEQCCKTIERGIKYRKERGL